MAGSDDGKAVRSPWPCRQSLASSLPIGPHLESQPPPIHGSLFGFPMCPGCLVESLKFQVRLEPAVISKSYCRKAAKNTTELSTSHFRLCRIDCSRDLTAVAFCRYFVYQTIMASGAMRTFTEAGFCFNSKMPPCQHMAQFNSGESDYFNMKTRSFAGSPPNCILPRVHSTSTVRLRLSIPLD